MILTLVITLALFAAVAYCLRSEGRQDRLITDAWNATRPKQDWPTR